MRKLVKNYHVFTVKKLRNLIKLHLQCKYVFNVYINVKLAFTFMLHQYAKSITKMIVGNPIYDSTLPISFAPVLSFGESEICLNMILQDELEESY